MNASLIIIEIKSSKLTPLFWAILGTSECFVKPGNVLISNSVGWIEDSLGTMKSTLVIPLQPSIVWAHNEKDSNNSVW